MHRHAASVVLAVAMLAGCSSEASEPEPLPKVSPSVAVMPSPSPSDELAAVPPAAQEQSPQGAGAFARFYYAQLERAFSTGDADAVERLSTPACEGCMAYVDSVRRIKAAGNTAVDVTFDVKVAEAPGFTSDEARVSVIYDTVGSKVLDSSGVAVFENPASQGNEVDLTLVRREGRWLVQSLQAY